MERLENEIMATKFHLNELSKLNEVEQLAYLEKLEYKKLYFKVGQKREVLGNSYFHEIFKSSQNFNGEDQVSVQVPDPVQVPVQFKAQVPVQFKVQDPVQVQFQEDNSVFNVKIPTTKAPTAIKTSFPPSMIQVEEFKKIPSPLSLKETLEIKNLITELTQENIELRANIIENMKENSTLATDISTIFKKNLKDNEPLDVSKLTIIKNHVIVDINKSINENINTKNKFTHMLQENIAFSEKLHEEINEITIYTDLVLKTELEVLVSENICLKEHVILTLDDSNHIFKNMIKSLNRKLSYK
jgi:hypothetical protein